MHVREVLEEEPEIAAKALRLLAHPETDFPILTAKVKLTWRCNLKCSFCTVWRRAATAAEVPTLPPDRVCDLLQNLHRRGLRKVHFSGGEVFLLRHLPDVISCARSLDLQVNLTTNGTLLGKEQARMLVEARVHSVAVSIDAPRARRHDELRGVPGAFQAAVSGIRNLVDRKAKKGRGPVVAVNTVVTRRNIGELGELYEKLKAWGVERWRLLPVDSGDKKIRPSRSQWQDLAGRWDAWEDLLTRLPVHWVGQESGRQAAKGRYAATFYRKNRCFAPWFHFYVDADGRAFSCCMGRAELPSYGNVLSQDLEALLGSPGRREVCSAMASGHVYSVCKKCDDFIEENSAFFELYRQAGDGVPRAPDD